MAPLKRPSSALAPAAKKHHGASKAKLAAVVKALKETESYPHSVVAMLSQHIELSLGVAKEERHEYQSCLVEMIGEVLQSVQKQFDDKISEAEAKVSQADAEKEKREAGVKDAASAVEAANEALKAAEAASKEALSKRHEAHVASQAAQQEQRDGDASLEAAASKKLSLEHVVNESFEPLKTSSLEAEKLKSAIAAIAKAGKDFHCDASLITSFGSALSKPAAERGNFDVLVIDQLENAFKSQIEAFATELAEGSASREARAAQVAAATASLDAASAAEDAAGAALVEARQHSKAADQAHKVGTKLLKSFGPEMKATQSELAAL